MPDQGGGGATWQWQSRRRPLWDGNVSHRKLYASSTLPRSGSAHPLLLFGGVAGCMCAVVADSQSHPPKRRSSLASADGAQAVAAATEEERLESEVERAIRVIKQAESVAIASPVPPTRLALAEDEGGEEKQGVAGAGAPGAGAPGAGTPGASEARRALPTAPMSAVELEEGGRLPASSTGSSGSSS